MADVTIPGWIEVETDVRSQHIHDFYDGYERLSRAEWEAMHGVLRVCKQTDIAKNARIVRVLGDHTLGELTMPQREAVLVAVVDQISRAMGADADGFEAGQDPN